MVWFAARKALIIGSYELVNELSDEKRFYKSLSGPLIETRAGLADGLFTVRQTS